MSAILALLIGVAVAQPLTPQQQSYQDGLARVKARDPTKPMEAAKEPPVTKCPHLLQRQPNGAPVQPTGKLPEGC